MEQGKISSAQLACLFFMAALSTSMLTGPSFIFTLADRDMWLSAVLSPLIGMPLIFIIIFLHKLFPGQTIMQYNRTLLGKSVGTLLSLLFLFNLLILNGIQTRQFFDFMSQNYFAKTPGILFAASMTLIGAIAIRCGVEIICRIAMLLTPLIILIVFAIILPLTKEIDLGRLLPIMENGFVPVAKGTIALQTWFSMYAYMSFFLPFVSNPKRLFHWGSMAALWTAATFLSAFVYIVGVLGEAVSNYMYPLMILSRYVEIFEFIEHLDSLLMLFWVLDVFLRTCMTYFAVTAGFAQLFGTINMRAIVMPVGLLILCFSFWSIPNLTAFRSMTSIYTIYYIAINMAYPCLLLAIAKLRGFRPPPSSPDEQTLSMNGANAPS
ncbi:GerAB/ArcD/ProY family transporter [Paenibacillus sp. MMS18-CY102]|uniref:GerAB/ArcD/ProY family transporter n=1 Tax=Paenibacillus sp. MMS18-CY102 TaxID=2682849 RepID=UPI001365EEFF|nr:endospore germination permease [Paenibacillus sp. MMS18-CY102]MWC27248.1 endospore germination permease [Paenibacillus sp. MMS18-CY102]